MANLTKEPQKIKSLDGFQKMMDGAMQSLYTMKLEYHVEEAKIKGDVIEVKYCPKGEERSDDPIFYEDSIDLEKLREYVEYWGLNTVTKDFMEGGEYCQETFTLDFETYMEDWENREHAVAEYLREGGEVVL